MSNENLELVMNQRFFVSAIMSLLKLCKTKSESLSNLNETQIKSHTKFRETCDIIMNEYTNKDGSDVDQGRIIKKVFTTLKESIEELKTKNKQLFTKKNKENKITTIIPGLNLGLIVDLFDEDELKTLWQYVYMMFITSVKMIYTINQTKKNTEIWNVMLELEKDLAQSGILVGGKVFNPYVGLGAEGENMGVDELMKSAELIKDNNGNSTNILSSLGVDKLLDSEKLGEQLKNISQSDIDEATKNIAQLLGASDDNDINDVCSTLVNDIVADLKENGIQGMFQVAERVSSKVSNKIDMNKMKKAATKMSTMLTDNNDKLKNMKDENGNLVGEEIMKKLNLPYNLMNLFGNNKKN